jgi:hypothetical protein
MLTANLKFRVKKNLFFLSLQCFTLKIEERNDSYSQSKYLRAPFAENKHVQLCPDKT